MTMAREPPFHLVCHQLINTILRPTKKPPLIVLAKDTKSVTVVIYRPFPYYWGALRMNVLHMISPRGLSVFFTTTIGSVIPTFSSLSSSIVLFILVLYIVPQSYKDIDLLKHIISASPLVKSHTLR